jgi:diguanylate cyclase (GGDEF)-like protein
VVAEALSGASAEDWFLVRGKTWLLDLGKLRERFKLPLDWLDGVVVVEPEYDILPDTFRKDEMHGMLRLIVEREDLHPAPEPPWHEYPEEDRADLVPLLRRLAFDRDIERMFRESAERTCAIVIIDLDHFKKVNDTFGHPVGDTVLIRVAEVIRAIVGRRGRGYRYGGEEMAILLPDFSAGETHPLVERIRETVQAELWPAHDGLNVTISAGVAEARGGTAPATVLAAADKALYAAKHGGRNRTVRA